MTSSIIHNDCRIVKCLESVEATVCAVFNDIFAPVPEIESTYDLFINWLVKVGTTYDKGNELNIWVPFMVWLLRKSTVVVIGALFPNNVAVVVV